VCVCVCFYIQCNVCMFVCVCACDIQMDELQYEPFFIKHIHMHAPTHTLKCIKTYTNVLNLCSETLSEGRTSQPLSCESSLRLGLRNEVGRFLCVRVYECVRARVCVRVRMRVRVIVFGSVCVRQKHRQGHVCGYGHRYRNRYTCTY